jgi:pSer/pThr/pTyr-binding forkhead associated (FHA) protein
MPVTVLIRSASGGEAPSLTFDGPRIVIGRSVGADVRLPDPSVSQRHATIRAQGTEYAIVDEGSTNGTWVGGVRLGPQTPRLVKTGDLVRVGRVWLEIAVGQRPPTPDLGLATRDLALELVRNAMEAAGDDTVAKVRVVEGPDIGAELRLLEEGRPYVIGRAERCDLPLADEDASREHAAVVRRGAQVMLRDLGSMNGVYLGDTRLAPHRDVAWRPPVMARVGRSVLALDEPVSIALAQLEAAADEHMNEADAPPPPPPSFARPPNPGALPTSASPPSFARPPNPSVPPTSASLPESRMAVAKPAPIADVASRSATTVPRAQPRGRQVWTTFDVVVVTMAVAVIALSIAGLVWVLK